MEVDDVNEYNNLTSHMDENISACQNDLNNVVKNQSDTIKYHKNKIMKYKSTLQTFVKLKPDETDKLKECENIKEPDLNKSRDLVDEYQKQIQKVSMEFKEMDNKLATLNDEFIEEFDRIHQNLIEMAW